MFVDESPERNPVGIGEVVTTWEDEHGQWDLAVVRVRARGRPGRPSN
ncbi:hypothetical protein [Actinosynnema pretiosum]|nr:hypothetical protein [Actinosynnema pretiosum]